jgi:hypothetical protein
VQMLSAESSEEQVSAFVGDKLSQYKYVQEIKQFIIDERIDGSIFLGLTENDLLDSGLKTIGERKTLMTLVEQTKRTEIKRFEIQPLRLKRWEALNESFYKVKNKKSAADSCISWDLVKPIFGKELIQHEMPIEPIPNEDFLVLSKVLSWIIRSYKSQLFSGNRLHLIAPIIWSVTQLFSDISVQTEQDLNGVYVKAHCYFEFFILRGDVRICIKVAKKEDFEQGMAHNLVGCEVAADLYASKLVYGVVTNFEKWIFIKSGEESILYDEQNAITFDGKGCPVKSQLASVVGKLHAVLLGQ